MSGCAPYNHAFGVLIVRSLYLLQKSLGREKLASTEIELVASEI